MMFGKLKLNLKQLTNVEARVQELAFAGVTPRMEESSYRPGCGDGTCAQSCSGGCGKDCSAFFSECVMKI